MLLIIILRLTSSGQLNLIFVTKILLFYFYFLADECVSHNNWRNQDKTLVYYNQAFRGQISHNILLFDNIGIFRNQVFNIFVKFSHNSLFLQIFQAASQLFIAAVVFSDTIFLHKIYALSLHTNLLSQTPVFFYIFKCLRH